MMRTGALVAVLQNSAKPRNQRLAVKFNERFVAPEAAAAAAGENKSSHICSGSHKTVYRRDRQSPVTRSLLHRLQTTTLLRSARARAANPELAQFFLQALAVQADRRRRARHIPAMTHKLLRQIRDLKFVLRLAKIVFAEADVCAIAACLADKRFAGRHFFRQIR